MYQISPRDFSELNRAISDEIEIVLLKFVSDGKIKMIPDKKSVISAETNEKRKRGRPRKVQSEEKIEQKEKKSRGRPRKIKTDESPGNVPERKRGRPKKS